MQAHNSYVFWENKNIDAALNLAIEEVLLDSDYTKEHNILMLWQNKSSVIIGRHQNAFEEVDMPYLEKNNIDLIRRPTGGGAVYHDLGNLNFSFIMPTSSPKVDFHIFLAPMVEALNSIGIPAITTGRNDIVANARKVCGTAQAKGKHAILVHGAMLIDTDLDILEHVLAGNPDKYTSKGISSVRSRVVNMQEFLSSEKREESLAIIKDCIKNTFAQRVGAGIASLPEEVIKEIEYKAVEKAKERYANPKWTLNQSPPFSSSLRKKFAFGSVRVNYNVSKGCISGCKIEGDFFALKDISDLEKILVGVVYNSENIRKQLEDFCFSDFILNADKQELISLFSEC